MGSARGPNKRIRKKGRKKEEFEARFVLDIEIPIQVDHRASPDLQRMKLCYAGPSAQRSVFPLVQSSPNTSWTRGS